MYGSPLFSALFFLAVVLAPVCFHWKALACYRLHSFVASGNEIRACLGEEKIIYFWKTVWNFETEWAFGN
jgi:hypothetical protein